MNYLYGSAAETLLWLRTFRSRRMSNIYFHIKYTYMAQDHVWTGVSVYCMLWPKDEHTKVFRSLGNHGCETPLRLKRVMGEMCNAHRCLNGSQVRKGTTTRAYDWCPYTKIQIRKSINFTHFQLHYDIM